MFSVMKVQPARGEIILEPKDGEIKRFCGEVRLTVRRKLGNQAHGRPGVCVCGGGIGRSQTLDSKREPELYK